MAGGLFDKKPFTLNIKCIIFSLIIMTLFLYKPNIKNKYILSIVLFLIFALSYISMAWYDYFFDCQNLPFKRASFSITGLFKPPIHSDQQLEEKNGTNKDKNNSYKIIIYASHILFIVPFLLYLVYKKGNVTNYYYGILSALLIFTFGYHSIGLFNIINK